LSAGALATPAPLNEARPLDWSVVTDSFGTAVDYPAAIFTSPAAPPPRGVGHSFRSADGSALFMMYVERNDGHDTPQSYVRRNLTKPQSLLKSQRSKSPPARSSRRIPSAAVVSSSSASGTASLPPSRI